MGGAHNHEVSLFRTSVTTRRVLHALSPVTEPLHNACLCHIYGAERERAGVRLPLSRFSACVTGERVGRGPAEIRRFGSKAGPLGPYPPRGDGGIIMGPSTPGVSIAVRSM